MKIRRRNLMVELMEGIDALAQQRAAKRTLRTHTLLVKQAPEPTSRTAAKLRRP